MKSKLARPGLPIARRSALAVGLASLAVGAQTRADTKPAAASLANSRITLNLVTAWSEKLGGMVDLLDRFSKRVSELSGGTLVISGQHQEQAGIPALELMDAVASGRIDLAHSTAYYWTKRSTGFNFFATVPFGMMAHEHYAWLRFGGGLELWRMLASKFGVEVLPCGNTGVQMGGWFRKKLTSTEDLQGLKVRYPGLGGEILRRMGALPVTLPATGIKAGLQSGALDAAEWASPWNDLDLGLHEVCSHYYFPGIHEPGHTLELLINPGVWSRLSRVHQEVLRSACWLEYGEMQAQFNHGNARLMPRLTSMPQLQVLRFPNDIVREFRKLAPGVIRDVVAGDALAQEISRSYRTYLQMQLRWAELADRAYWQARYT